jgi:hypothetical protein
LFVADRGAVAFEVPQKWVVRHDKKGTLTIHDKEPPDDSARLSLTVFHLPPVEGGWGQLPLEKMMRELEQVGGGGKKKKKHKKPSVPLVIHKEPRFDSELLWAEKGNWPDPQNGRLIRCRQIMARARLVQILVTFDVYVDCGDKFEPAWADLLRSMQVAVPRDITGHIKN